MQILASRQSNTNRSTAFSGSVLAALLSALLLLSPTTARALANVLSENGVSIPAHVVRILDTLPADPIRESPRRLSEGEEAPALSPATAATDHEHVVAAPSFVAVLTATTTLSFPPASIAAPVSPQATRSLAVSRRTDSRSPRAPPIFCIA